MTVRLPAEVYSPDQIGIVLWELGGLVASVRTASIKEQVTQEAGDSQQPHISSLLFSVLRSTGVSAGDLQALERLQLELQALRGNAPVAHLLLGALPTVPLKREIVGWFRTQIHPQLLVTFATRTDLGGGFVLRVGSRQYDFTYRAQLLEGKHRLVELFDNGR